MKKLIISLFVLLVTSGCTDIGSEAIIDSEAKTKPANAALTGLPEHAILAGQLDLTTYAGTIETDNEENRIIIFTGEAREDAYKSVYVKDQNRLVITQLKNDVLLYDAVISP